MRARALLISLALLLVAPAAASAADLRVNAGSPSWPFAQNKQNEPVVAIDPSNPSHVAAGSNDEIDLEACAAGDPTTCPFTPGVGVTGFYWSTNGGASWAQPTYTGISARHCLGPDPCVTDPNGPIGTVPNYAPNLVSDGDPAMVFGPRRGANGRFSWANGSRLYYANLTSNVPGRQGFRGVEAIAVSRTDSFPPASNSDWLPPVIVSKQNSALFSDKEQIWADNAASSPYFGNVYLCNAAFRGVNSIPEPIVFSRSTDAGDTWQNKQISQATNNAQTGGRQGCGVRTDSRGRVYVIWIGYDKQAASSALYQVTSDDGGVTFTRPRVIQHIQDVGLLDPGTGDFTFDGVAGARTWSAPSFDIANGAPSGANAPNTIALTWPDGPTPTDRTGGPNEQALVATSTDRGATYVRQGSASPAGDRPDFPAIAISPDGTDAYLTYTSFLQPWQSSILAPARLAEGVVRHADVTGGGVGAWSDIQARSPDRVGDARGSSTNSLVGEFLGDYSYAAATNDFGALVWNDVRNAADCPAVDAYRQEFAAAAQAGTVEPEGEDLPEIRAEQNARKPPADDEAGPEPPDVQAECPPTGLVRITDPTVEAFGNSDIYGGSYADPTP